MTNAELIKRIAKASFRKATYHDGVDPEDPEAQIADIGDGITVVIDGEHICVLNEDFSAQVDYVLHQINVF